MITPATNGSPHIGDFMSLLNIFRPKWQHSDPKVRVQAILELGNDSQSIFETIASSDESAEVREAAIRKLSNIDSLRKIFKQESDDVLRRLAGSRLHEEIAKVLKAHRIPATKRELDLLKEVSDTRLVEDLLKNMPSSELRLELVKLTDKQGPLSQCALKDAKEEVALAALDRVESESLLREIFQSSRHTSVRKKAGEHLKKGKEAKESGENATVLLFRKREALVQQAKRLTEDEKVLDNEPAFESLLQEATALGMGPAQADLDAIHKKFTDKCDEARRAKEETAEKERERKAKQEAQISLVDDFEHLLNAYRPEAKAKAEEILKQGATLFTDAKSAFAKRFDFLKTRYEKLAAETEAAANEAAAAPVQNEGDGTPALTREEILEELKALASQNATEAIGHRVKALARMWESFPLMEGDDPLLQAYNALRNQFTEKISAMNENLKKTIEENTAKLREIIESIKKINENEDFREISKMLRDSYHHWKEIVGEDKFRYQEIWKEYRDATSRFQEMQEWESWHNERDRENILEEMELLAKDTPSKEMLYKLRGFSNQWKAIGPVSSARLGEFRDKFRALFEQIMTLCEPVLKEQEEERQKNLAEKEKICAEVEVLSSDASDNWRDKFKTMQQFQEAWKAVGQVPRENNQPLWDRFRVASNIFYTKHKEFLKKEDAARAVNYDAKIKLCEQAEALSESTDWNGTTNKLKKLQEDWKSVGPAPKVQSEAVWNRFRTACDKFFEAKRAHYEAMDSEKETNFTAKEALCAKLEALDLDPKNPETVKAVTDIETEWKTIGMVPREKMDALWDRYCASADKFQDRLAEADPAVKESLMQSKAQKESMFERVNALMDSSGANQSADTVRELQQAWRDLPRCGTAEQNLYKRFRDACDEFFNRRRDQLEIQEQARDNNLQKKVLLCEQAERLLQNDGGDIREAMNEVKRLRRLWKEVGAVPRNESEKIWQRFNTACDAVFAQGRGEAPANSGTQAPAAPQAPQA